MRASSGVGLEGIRSRANCRPAMVATMKVPPTKTAEAVSIHKDCWHSGSKVPNAMTAWAAAQTFLRGQADSQRDAKATDNPAAAPKMGQVRPKISGSETSCLAMVGKYVAGMM